MLVPTPASLSTSIEPPCRLATPYAMLNPRPFPRSPFVLKNGSNTLAATADSCPPHCLALDRYLPSHHSSAYRDHSAAGIASTALSTMFVRTYSKL